MRNNRAKAADNKLHWLKAHEKHKRRHMLQTKERTWCGLKLETFIYEPNLTTSLEVLTCGNCRNKILINHRRGEL